MQKSGNVYWTLVFSIAISFLDVLVESQFFARKDKAEAERDSRRNEEELKRKRTSSQKEEVERPG